MLSTTLPLTTNDTKVCWLCRQSIVLDHHTTDEHGLSVHSSCHEKQMLLHAATREAELWRRNFAKGKTA
jgi:hypothetical protein